MHRATIQHMAFSSFTAVAIFHSVTLWHSDGATQCAQFWLECKYQTFPPPPCLFSIILKWTELLQLSKLIRNTVPSLKSLIIYTADFVGKILSLCLSVTADVYVFVNVHDSGVLLAQWSAAVRVEGVWSFWVCSGNSFPLHRLRHAAAWSSHLSDHTFCPVCCGSDMSGSFVQLNTTYTIPMGFTDSLWRWVNTSLILSHGLMVYLNVIYQDVEMQSCTGM